MTARPQLMTLEPAEETYIRLTPQGQRFAEKLSKLSPAEQERTILARMRQGEAVLKNQRKQIILDVLRTEGDEDGHFVLLEKICSTLDLPVIETVLLLHEMNGSRFDVPDGETSVYCFFNHGSGQVYVELWEPDGGDRAR
jgi:hypothetical protein